MVDEEGRGLGIAGFVFSLISLLFLILFAPIGLILGIVGLILCIIQLKKQKTGLAIAGLVISIISIILCILAIIALIFVWMTVQNTLSKGLSNINQIKNNLSQIHSNISK